MMWIFTENGMLSNRFVNEWNGRLISSLWDQQYDSILWQSQAGFVAQVKSEYEATTYIFHAFFFFFFTQSDFLCVLI